MSFAVEEAEVREGLTVEIEIWRSDNIPVDVANDVMRVVGPINDAQWVIICRDESDVWEIRQLAFFLSRGGKVDTYRSGGNFVHVWHYVIVRSAKPKGDPDCGVWPESAQRAIDDCLAQGQLLREHCPRTMGEIR